MRNKGIPVTIALICMILGLMLTVQFKSIKTMNSTSIEKQRVEDVLKKLKETEAKLEESEKKINQFEETAFKKDKIMEVIEQETEQTKMLAGLKEVKGQGLVVTLNDSKVKNTQEYMNNDNYYIIHDSDILMVVNELRASGAEAISLNNQRIISTSEIRCAGPVLSINKTTTSVPFVITAIGNMNEMENALKMRGGVVDNLEQWGIEIDIKKKDNLIVPKYNGTIQFKYAYPVKEEGNK